MDSLKKTFEKTNNHRISLIGLQYDAGSSFLKGSADAPQFIREAFYSPSANMWTELGVCLGNEGIFADVGDVACQSENPLSEIENAAAVLLEKGTVPVFMGGDHTVTYPIIRAFAKKFNGLNILQFDAHPDLYDEFEGNRYSHACPFARIMEENLIAKLVQVGIRALNDHHREQAEKFGVHMIEMRQMNTGFIELLSSPLYISLDMDALDPAFAPGVSHHEPGGLSARQIIDIIHSLKAKIVGADIVEVNPRRDPLGITAMAAAKLLKEIMGKCILQ